VRDVTLLAPTSPRAQVDPPRAAYGYGERMHARGLTQTAAGMPTAALAATDAAVARLHELAP